MSNNQDWCKKCKRSLIKEYNENNKNNHKVVVKKNYACKQVKAEKTICECGRIIYLVPLKAHLKSNSFIKKDFFIN